MSDQSNKPSGDKDIPELVNALREMGQQFEAVFRAAVESDRVKQLQQEVASGVRQISSQVETAIKSVQADPRVQQAEERGREAFQQVQQSKVMQDVQEALVTGIGMVNEQLRKVMEQLKTDGAATGNTTQHVPVEHDAPATGETTKLDD